MNGHQKQQESISVTSNIDKDDEQKNRQPYIINTLTDSHDDMRSRKAGELVFDERRGKWYRVKKMIFPTHITSGPKNLGDPDDRFLRHIEKDVLIPDIMAKRIEKIECRDDFKEFIKCMRSENELIAIQRCKDFINKFRECKLQKFRDPKFHEKITEEFLKERADYRRTGLNRQRREFEKYLKWKEEQLAKKIERENVSNK